MAATTVAELEAEVADTDNLLICVPLGDTTVRWVKVDKYVLPRIPGAMVSWHNSVLYIARAAGPLTDLPAGTSFLEIATA